MQIPIQNIYFLLCYAWDCLDEKGKVGVDASAYRYLPDLFARVLINGCRHLFKRGLDRNYVETEETLNGLRGKIDFNVSMKRLLFPLGMAHCHFDEFHHNILHNQILKSTIVMLMRMKLDERSHLHELRALYQKFHNVDTIRLTGSTFKKVHLHRNNGFYRFLLHICELICEEVVIDRRTGEYVFKEFAGDPRQMGALFEKFVRNFYKKEQKRYQVSSEYISWNAVPLAGSSVDILPKMKTDISLESANRKIIIDTKFYAEAVVTNFDKEQLRSGHVYQMHAYLNNVAKKGGLNETCEGMVLYPEAGQNLAVSFQMGAHKISFRTIDLSRDWRQIVSELLGFLN